jgi:squalene cyclase
LKAQRLKAPIEQAGQFLKKSQQATGAFQDSTNALFNTWETILVTDALLDYYSSNDTSIQKAISWLKTMENKDQLVCHNEKCKDNYCIETSALYLRLMSRIEDPTLINPQLLYLVSLQETDGSWNVGNPAVTERINFPSVTGFVLNLFDTLNFQYNTSEKSISYLIDQQLADGSWGQTWEYYNSPAYALWQILPVLKSTLKGKEAFQKGLNFVLNNQLENGSWYFVDAQIKNHISAELQTALMLSCLIEEKDNKSLEAFEKGLNFLLKQQKNNGSWDGGMFSIPSDRYKKREYLFATSLIFKILVQANKSTIHE